MRTPGLPGRQLTNQINFIYIQQLDCCYWTFVPRKPYSTRPPKQHVSAQFCWCCSSQFTIFLPWIRTPMLTPGCAQHSLYTQEDLDKLTMAQEGPKIGHQKFMSPVILLLFVAHFAAPLPWMRQQEPLLNQKLHHRTVARQKLNTILISGLLGE